jgi:hypothetical protein
MKCDMRWLADYLTTTYQLPWFWNSTVGTVTKLVAGRSGVHLPEGATYISPPLSIQWVRETKWPPPANVATPPLPPHSCRSTRQNGFHKFVGKDKVHAGTVGSHDMRQCGMSGSLTRSETGTFPSQTRYVAASTETSLSDSHRSWPQVTAAFCWGFTSYGM